MGFFFPLVGLILFLVWIDSKPKSAKMAGLGALIDVLLTLVGTIVYFVVIYAILSTSSTSSVLLF